MRLKKSRLLALGLCIAFLCGRSIPGALARDQHDDNLSTEASFPSEDISSGKVVPLLSTSGPASLIVILVDGRLLALDPNTGAEAWTWDTGSPLVSSAGLTAGGADGAHDGADGSFHATRTLVPGVDGALYAYHHQNDDGDLQLGLQKQPQTIPELVDASPSMMADGSVVLGSRTTSVYLLDPDSGTLVSGFFDVGASPADLPGLIGLGPEEVAGSQEPYAGGKARPLAIGRHVYRLGVSDPATGEERWNISFARVHPLTPQARRAALDWRNMPSVLEDEVTTADPGLLGISVEGHLLLKRRDPSTGRVIWSRRLSAAPVGVYTSDGAAVPLHHGPLRTHSQVVEGQDAIFVSLVEGSLVALPTTHIPGMGQRPSDFVAGSPEGWRGSLAEGSGVSGDPWACPLGYHPVEPALALPPSQQMFLPPGGEPVASQGPFVVLEQGWLHGLTVRAQRIFQEKRWLSMLAALFVGALLYSAGQSLMYFRKPHVDTAVDRDANGALHMEVNFTGTNQQLNDLKRSSRTALEARAGDGPTIRDYTGSGVGNSPDESSSSASSSGKGSGRQKKKGARHPRYSNKRNGLLQQLASQASTASDPDKEEDEESPRFPDEQNGDVLNPRPPIQERTTADGQTRVGKVILTPEILGYGSSGTLVFEGTLDGRPVAVKRLLRQFYELARKEISALILADEHPNVVRCFALEQDNEFVYLALERCKESLHERFTRLHPDANEFIDDAKMPTPFCLDVVEQAAQGLMALHERGIVHRDLKPHNVLLTENNRVKISDMGLCKRVALEQSSFDSPGPGGSSGWQAPEQLVNRSGGDMRQGKSVDVFSYGLLLFYCLSGGEHAFGKSYERDLRILQARPGLQAVRHMPEAENLVKCMIHPNGKKRPPMAAVMAHPFWWSPARRLAFLIHLSDRVEPEDREEDKTLLAALEECMEEAVGGRDWSVRLDPKFIDSLGKYRKYNYCSLRDLLRVIRNKHNHFRDMSPDLQAKLGPVPEGYIRYFATRFPRLLLTAYGFALKHCAGDDTLRQYFPPAARSYNFLSDLPSRQEAKAAASRATAAVKEAAGAQSLKDSRDGMVSDPAGPLVWASLEPIPETNDDVQGRAHSAPVPLGGSATGEPEALEVAAVSAEPETSSPPEAMPSWFLEPVCGPFSSPALESSLLPPLPVRRALGEAPGTPVVGTLGEAPATPSHSQGWAMGGLWGTHSHVQPEPQSTPDPVWDWGPRTSGGTAAASTAPATLTAGRSGSPLWWPSLGVPPGTSAGGASTPPPPDPLAVPESPSFNGVLQGLNIQSPLLSTPWATPPPPIKSRLDPNGARDGGANTALAHKFWATSGGTLGLPDATPPPASPLTTSALLPPTSPWSPRVEDTDVTSRLKPRVLSGFHHRSGSDGAFLHLNRSPSEVASSYRHQRSSSGDAFPLGRPAGLGGGRSEEEMDHIGFQLYRELLDPIGDESGRDGQPSSNGAAASTSSGIPRFPQRPGQTVCDFFSKTGHCKFGEQCKFDHPACYAVKYNLARLPLRPGEPICGFFERTGECKFGASCKFHHPDYPLDHVFENGSRVGPRLSLSQPPSPALAASPLPPGSAPGKLRRPSGDVSKSHPSPAFR